MTLVAVVMHHPGGVYSAAYLPVSRRISLGNRLPLLTLGDNRSPGRMPSEVQVSSIGWVDFSSEHRNRVKTVLDALTGRGVVDELGIAQIRDTLSDGLFPGISTIQTRAKYFLTLPRIFKAYAALTPYKRKRLALGDFLVAQEKEIRNKLVVAHQKDGATGIIGSTFYDKDRDVARAPSSVYWNGLRVFNLVQTDWSLAQFIDNYADPNRALSDIIAGTDKLRGDDHDAAEREDVCVLSYTDGDGNWLESLSLHLSAGEARFLLKRMTSPSRVLESLLGHILLSDEARADFVSGEYRSFDDFCDRALVVSSLTGDMKTRVLDARDFWRLMEGAHILYNCLLQKRFGSAEIGQAFEARFSGWLARMERFEWERWDTGRLWERAREENRGVESYTQAFVTSWIDEARSPNPSRERMETLVIAQERGSKGSRAKLRRGADHRVSKWVGLDGLGYRLSQARAIVRDIQEGLTRGADV